MPHGAFDFQFDVGGGVDFLDCRGEQAAQDLEVLLRDSVRGAEHDDEVGRAHDLSDLYIAAAFFEAGHSLAEGGLAADHGLPVAGGDQVAESILDAVHFAALLIIERCEGEFEGVIDYAALFERLPDLAPVLVKELALGIVLLDGGDEDVVGYRFCQRELVVRRRRRRGCQADHQRRCAADAFLRRRAAPLES